MSTYIKAGFWSTLCNDCKGFSGWLHLDEFVKNIAQLYPGPKGDKGDTGAAGTIYSFHYSHSE